MTDASKMAQSGGTAKEQANYQEVTTDNAPHPGYLKLADFMSKHPENAIFRRFGVFSMLNSLRLQAELNALEHQLWRTVGGEVKPKDAKCEGYSKDFQLLREWVQIGGSEQHDQLITIGEKLKEYGKRVMTVHKRSQWQKWKVNTTN